MSATSTSAGRFNLWSEFHQKPAALAFRGMVKLPTGDKDVGVSTGKPDFSIDFIGSKELRRKVELSGYGGYEFRGKPDGFDIPTGATRWGVGAGFPSRSAFRAALELVGSLPTNDTATTTSGLVVGEDGTIPPASSATQNMTQANVGLTWQHRKGFFIGGGLAWNFSTKNRQDFRSDEPDEKSSDFVDWQIRIGYHPGVRVYVPPPPPPPPLAPAGPDARAAGEPTAGGEGAVRSEHRGSRPNVDLYGDRHRSRWRSAHLQLDHAAGDPGEPA